MISQTCPEVFNFLSQVSAQLSAQFSSEICCLWGSGSGSGCGCGSAKIKDQPSANQYPE